MRTTTLLPEYHNCWPDMDRRPESVLELQKYQLQELHHQIDVYRKHGRYIFKMTDEEIEAKVSKLIIAAELCQEGLIYMLEERHKEVLKVKAKIDAELRFREEGFQKLYTTFGDQLTLFNNQ